MLKLFITIVTLYLAFVALMFFTQRSLLYLGSRHGLTTEQTARLSLEKWPDETDYRGYLHDPPEAEQTMVVFHGNAGEAANRVYYLDLLAATRSRIILAEYPGYGRRSGSPSERRLVEDAVQTLEMAAQRFPHQPLFVIGESLGAAVASAAIADDSTRVQALLLITPWDSLTRLAASHYRFLPVRWLLLDRYDSLRNLQSFKAPKAIVIAGRDSIVPPEHAERLYAGIPPIKARFKLDQAQHNDWPAHVDDRWWRDILWFLKSETGHPIAD